MIREKSQFGTCLQELNAAKDAAAVPRKMRRGREGQGTLGTSHEPWIVFTCDKCGRHGEYRRQRLIEEFGNTIAFPDLLGVFAHSRGCGFATSSPSAAIGERPCLIRYDVE